MMRLTKVEIRRLFSRRLTAIALLGSLLVIGLMLFGSFQTSQPSSSAETAAQKARFTAAQKDWDVNGEQAVQSCLKVEADAGNADPATSACNDMGPKAAEFIKAPPASADMMSSLVKAGGYLLAAVAFMIGAGFVSAELSSGSMGNWLTFEPRRMRVYGSKLAAACLGLIPATVAALGLLTAGVWLIVRLHAPSVVIAAKGWNEVAQIGGRAVALTLVAAMVGAAFGFLTRHIAAVLGIVIGYLIAETALVSLLPASQPWLLGINVKGWIEHGAEYAIPDCNPDSNGLMMCQVTPIDLTFGQSSAYLGVLAVLMIGLAAMVFRRRDVS